MSALKSTERPASSGATLSSVRKPWRKKTPIEAFVEQTDVLRSRIASHEKELVEMRKQLQKFEEARKILET